MRLVVEQHAIGALVAKPDQFPLDPAMTPAWILPGQADDQFTNVVTDAWTSGPVRKGPVPADQATEPRQQRRRRDDPMPPQLTRQATNQRGQHGPVWPR
jgi:hypothetical protein